LFLYYGLFETFVVHVKIAHGFLFRTGGYSIKLLVEGLVVNFEFIFDPFLLVIQILNTLTRQMATLYLLAVKTQDTHSFLVLLFSFCKKPLSYWVVGNRVLEIFLETASTGYVRFVLAHLRRCFVCRSTASS
jgi:hypothetical protein